MIWTDQQVDELRRLWDSGMSASQTAAAMNITRNAVIGKLHRLDGTAKSNIKEISPEEKLRKRDHKNERQRLRYHANSSPKRALKMQTTEAAPPPPEFLGDIGIPFADLRPLSGSGPNQCRYIADEPAGPDYRACGNETVPGESWCGHCRAIVFPKTNKTQEQRALHIRQSTRNHLQEQRKAAAA